MLKDACGRLITFCGVFCFLFIDEPLFALEEGFGILCFDGDRGFGTEFFQYIGFFIEEFVVGKGSAVVVAVHAEIDGVEIQPGGRRCDSVLEFFPLAQDSFAVNPEGAGEGLGRGKKTLLKNSDEKT